MFKNLLNRILPSGASGDGRPDALAHAQQLIADGNRSEDAGRLEAACDSYRQAVQAAPRLAAAHLNLGIALAAAGDLAGATRAYEAVLEIDPQHVFGNYNFATLAYMQGALDRAEALVRAALHGKADFVEAHVLLSNVLDDVGNADAAARALQEALRLNPDHAGAHFNHALLLRRLGRADDAERAVNRAIELDPGNAAAQSLLSSILQEHGLLVDAIRPLRAAIALAPERFDLRSRELLFLNFDECVTPEELFQKHLEFGALLERAIPARFDGRHRGSLEPARRLRVGYVSGDFRVHPVALFMLPVLEHHDRNAFEIICYSCGRITDHITERIRTLCDRWVDAAEMSDAHLAEVIHADAIDILVDLSGHTGASRVPVFSEKPAPVQMTWLGYLNTTGLTRMDYRLCDVRTDPPESSTALHTEKLLALSNSQWCYRPFIEIEASYEPPFQRNGFVTFGSFNQASKISAAMCMRWARILGRLPGSRLLVADVSSSRKRAWIVELMEQAGIARNRVQFKPRVDLTGYYMLYHEVDMALDCYPYGGGTTTLDSLWMGVPVVSAMGPTPVSRSAGSILSCLGLDPWIADSIGEYERVALDRAADSETIASLRRSLRGRLASSVLMDEPGFVRDLEGSFRRVWAERCQRR